MRDSVCRGGLGPAREPGGALQRLRHRRRPAPRRASPRRGNRGVEPCAVDRWNTGRTEAFNDGVPAIVITLLVLDLNVPAQVCA